jgi:hypothetical protein
LFDRRIPNQEDLSVGRLDKFTFGLLVVSISLNLALAWKVHGLKVELARDQTIAEGTLVDGLQVKTPSGRLTELRFSSSDKPTVVYIFSPACPWCAVNRDKITTLAKAQAGRFHFIGISLTPEGLEAYLRTDPLPFDVYTDLRNSDVAKFHLGTTPQTLVIGSNGRVVKSWLGAYIGSAEGEVKAFFGRASISSPQ